MRRYLFFIGLLAIAVAMDSCKGCGKPKRVVPISATDSTNVIKTPKLDSLSNLINASPDKVELYVARYKEYMKVRGYDAAMKDVEMAIQLDPKNAEHYIAESDVYFMKKDIVRAINSLEHGNALIPDNLPLLLTLGRYYYYKNEHEKATSTLNHVLQLDPSATDAYFYRAEVYKETGDTAKAILDFQRTIEHDPRYYDAYMELGVLNAAKKSVSALDYYKNALKIDSNSVEAKYGIAMYYQDKKDYTKAIEMYKEIVVDTPQYELPYYNLGYIYFQKDSLIKADRNFEIATSMKIDYADAYFMRGLIAEARKDDKNAQFFYDQTLKLNSQHPGAINGFGRLRDKKKK